MARRNKFGKYIISAGEVGSYTVCPESWRLTEIEHVKAKRSSVSKLGRQLHRDWASDYDQALFVTRGLRLIVLLILAAIAFYIGVG